MSGFPCLHTMKTYEKSNKRIWYDPHIRVWTMQVIDSQGYQVGDVDYTPFRKEAFDWLNIK